MVWHVACRLGLGLAVASLSAGALAGTAHVTFLNPEKFTDIGRYGDAREAAENRSQIAQHLEKLAARELPPDQALDVEVLDVALAGRFEYRHLWPREVRVMRAVTWPSIKLRYRLKLGDQVLAAGEETVSDMDYLQRINAYPTSDPRRYEKRMLDEWFEQRLVERKQALSR
jgi:Protein of unknown function (DUF3016)